MSEMRLGLRENLPQFALLVVLNSFVGAMVGLERTVLPLLGEQEFGLTSKTAITSFIVSFGITKAIINLVAARLSDRIGRKPILVVGWVLALPVPLLIIMAPAWWWIDLANVLLGANQAMAWSMTVIMKIDLVGPRRRGLALGLNEFAGYFAVGAMSWISGYIAAHSGLRQPFYLGIGIAIIGLLLSVLVIRETREHVALEAPSAPHGPRPPGLGRIFWVTSAGNLSLFAACQAGLVNNLNDGMSWSLYPLLCRVRAAHRAHRDRQGGLPGRLGPPPGGHWPALRPLGAQGPHRLGHDRAGRRDLADRTGAELCRLDPRRRAPGPRHRHGLSHPAGSDRGPCAPHVARLEPRRLPVLA